jgi:hypothetical protein
MVQTVHKAARDGSARERAYIKLCPDPQTTVRFREVRPGSRGTHRTRGCMGPAGSRARLRVGGSEIATHTHYVTGNKTCSLCDHHTEDETHALRQCTATAVARRECERNLSSMHARFAKKGPNNDAPQEGKWKNLRDDRKAELMLSDRTDWMHTPQDRQLAHAWFDETSKAIAHIMCARKKARGETPS